MEGVKLDPYDVFYVFGIMFSRFDNNWSRISEYLWFMTGLICSVRFCVFCCISSVAFGKVDM